MLVTSFAVIFLGNKGNFRTLYYDILPYGVRRYIRFPDIFKNKSSNSDLTQISQVQTQKEYRSTYWGFSVNHPQNFRAIQILDGVILANYGWSNDNPNYRLTGGDIKIEISVVDKIFEQPWYESREKFEEYNKFFINGEAVTFYKVTDSYPARGTYTFTAAEIIHDGFTYRFNIEKGGSASDEDIKKISESLRFIPRDEYLSLQKPVPAGMERFSNTRWGFAFDYPKSWNLGKFDPSYTVIDTEKEYVHVEIELLPRYLSLSGDFIEDVKKEASRQCAADGAGSSIYCPEGDINISTTLNTLGSEEYIITRKRVFEYYSGGKTEYEEKVVAFPLSFQEYYAIIFSPLNLASENDNGAVLELGNNFQYLEKASLEIIDGSLYRVLSSGEKLLLVNKEETGKIWDFTEIRSPDNLKSILLIQGGISPYFLYYIPSDNSKAEQIGWAEEARWSNNGRYFVYDNKPADAGPILSVYVYDTQTNEKAEISRGHKIGDLDFDVLGFSNLRWLDDDGGVRVHYDAYTGEMPYLQKISEGETNMTIGR